MAASREGGEVRTPAHLRGPEPRDLPEMCALRTYVGCFDGRDKHTKEMAPVLHEAYVDLGSHIVRAWRKRANALRTARVPIRIDGRLPKHPAEVRKSWVDLTQCAADCDRVAHHVQHSWNGYLEPLFEELIQDILSKRARVAGDDAVIAAWIWATEVVQCWIEEVIFEEAGQ